MLDATGNDVIDFGDLSVAEREVKAGGKLYVLVEASEDAACKYRNSQTRELVLGPDGKPTGLRNMADTGPYLLSLCLYEVTDKGRLPVPLKTIRSWPARVVGPLVDLARKMSKLDEEESIEVLEKRIADDSAKLARLKATTGTLSEQEKNS